MFLRSNYACDLQGGAEVAQMAQDDWSWGHRLEALCPQEAAGRETASAEGHS